MSTGEEQEMWDDFYQQSKCMQVMDEHEAKLLSSGYIRHSIQQHSGLYAMFPIIYIVEILWKCFFQSIQVCFKIENDTSTVVKFEPQRFDLKVDWYYDGFNDWTCFDKSQEILGMSTIDKNNVSSHMICSCL